MLSVRGGEELSHITQASDRLGGWLLRIDPVSHLTHPLSRSLTQEAWKAPCHARKRDSGTCLAWAVSWFCEQSSTWW